MNRWSLKIGVALAATALLGAATPALAKRADHGRAGYGAYAAVQAPHGVAAGESGAILIQDRDWSNQVGGTPYCAGKC